MFALALRRWSSNSQSVNGGCISFPVLFDYCIISSNIDTNTKNISDPIYDYESTMEL